MSVNSLTFEQSAAFLTDLYEQATGEKSIAVTDTGTFTSVGTTLLQLGYDPIIQSISQVIEKSIYSIRPYSMKFKGINVSEERWGSVTRKINFIDRDVVDDERLYTASGETEALTDGTEINPWKIRKPKVLQTNFYGGTQYEDYITIFRDQLDSALRDAGEFGRFIGGVLQNIKDKLTQIAEAEARSALINFMTGKYVGDTSNCINVLQAYYDETGTVLTPATMYTPANFEPFVKWFYAYVNTLTDFMSERSEKYHMNVSGKEIKRHTPLANLKAYMSGNMLNKVASEVLSSVFDGEKLKMIDFEKVNYWQSIETPYKVMATPTYLNTTSGELITAESTVTIENIIGCLFDEEALGTVRRNNWTATTPMNAATGTYNIYYHFRQQIWNDFTENGIVLYAGTVTESA